MAAALAALNADFAARELPRCAMRIGIASGSAVVGSIGSEGHLKYSAVGDVVVTAQRLEGTAAVNHDFEAQPCRILVSETTLSLLDRPFRTEPVGIVSLKGREEGVSVHRLLGAGAPV
jgi:adenylate cyclase